MTKSQIEACQKRNEQLKQDAVDGKVTIVGVLRSCADVDALLVDLAAAAETAREERTNQQELRNRIGLESTLRAEALRAVTLLRGKLAKARVILETFDQSTFTPQEKQDMQDVIAET